MSSEASQKALLYFLELLMNTKKSFTISQLTGHFGNQFFTADMRAVAGINEKGLCEFLHRHPSLFTIQGNTVALCNKDDNPGRQPDAGSNQSQSTLPDVCLESEAVEFLSQKLAKHRFNWVPIQCLTGYLSQLPAEMRRVIGPLAELKKFLMRHEHVFEVDVDLVRLREELQTVLSLEPDSFKFIPPLAFTDPAIRSLYSVSKTDAEHVPENIRLLLKDRSNSFTDPGKQHSQINQDKDTVFVTPTRTSNSDTNFSNSTLRLESAEQYSTPMTMTLTEYSAVMFLKSSLEMRRSMKVCDLMEYTKQTATESVRNILGSSQPRFENFLKQYPQIFSISCEELVGLVKNAKLCVIVTGNRSSHAELSRNIKEESRKFPTLSKLSPMSNQSVGNPNTQPVRKFHQDKDNEMLPSGDDLQKHIGVAQDLNYGIFNSSLYHSRRKHFLTMQESCIPQAVKKTYTSVACQTNATSDIIATQFYLDS